MVLARFLIAGLLAHASGLILTNRHHMPGSLQPWIYIGCLTAWACALNIIASISPKGDL